MTAKLQFSAEFSEEAKTAFGNAVSGSGAIFSKGVPKDADPADVGHIEGAPRIEGNYAELTFVSGPYTRVHDALFRFRKQIPAVLGKFRMGLREIEISGYTVTMTGAFLKSSGYRHSRL